MKFRYRIEYAALKALLGFYAVMPVPMASAIGGAVFRTLGPLMGISRTARRNIKNTFPAWDDAKIDATLKGMWDNFGRLIAEYPHLDTLVRKYTVFRPGTPEILKGVYDSGKPCVFVSGHLGNWEVLPPALLVHSGVAMHSVYRAPNNPLVDRLLVNYRRFDGRLRSFGKNRRGLAETMRALQNNETVGMLIDQKMNTGIEVPFFGRPAMTSTAFVELARKMNCPLVPGRIIRTKGCHFEINLIESIPVGDRPTEEIVADVHGVLERWITEHPEQWLWLHRRWKNA